MLELDDWRVTGQSWIVDCSESSVRMLLAEYSIKDRSGLNRSTANLSLDLKTDGNSTTLYDLSVYSALKSVVLRSVIRCKSKMLSLYG